MALIKQPVNINFSKGLDTKSDPFQVPVGTFLALENSVFDTYGRLTKRNGFGALTTPPANSNSYLSTFKTGLVGIGTELSSYSPSLNSWTQAGAFRPVGVASQAVSRSANNQSACDSALSGNIGCFVYVDGTTPMYMVSDISTNTVVVPPTAIAGATSIPTNSVIMAPKIYLLGSHFIILFSGTGLRYLAIQTSSPTTTSTAALDGSNTPQAFDAVVISSTLYAAYLNNAGQSSASIPIRAVTLTSSLVVGTPTVVVSSIGAFGLGVIPYINLVADTSSTPFIYIIVGAKAWFFDINSGTYTGCLYVAAMNTALVSQFTPQLIFSAGTHSANSAVGTATGGVLSLFYATETGALKKTTVTNVGVVGSITLMDIFEVFIATKATLLSGKSYFVLQTLPAAFTFSGGNPYYGATLNISASYQPTYFLIDQNSNIYAKLSYLNAGGEVNYNAPTTTPADTLLYPLSTLSNLTVSSSTLEFAGLFKDLIQPVSASATVTTAGGTFSQSGTNLYQINLSPSSIQTDEIGNNLHLSGGLLTMFDGAAPVEHSFSLAPEVVSLTGVAVATVSGSITNLSNIITVSGSTAGFYVGLEISGPGLPLHTKIVSIVANTSITASNQVLGNHSGTYSTVNLDDQEYFYKAVYSWLDFQGNLHRSAPSLPVSITSVGNSAIQVAVTSLNLTTKDNVVIEIYRYSAGQQTYYETTSVAAPFLNDPTVATQTFQDQNFDSDILGNTILYTTGGVLPNDASPATSLMAMWQSRLWVVNAEDTNLLWYSKQVIEATPVEFSADLTLYIPPTQGVQTASQGVSALYAMDDKLIIFKRNSIYYVTGQGPDITGAQSTYGDPIIVNATVGCTNPNSIVLMPSGLMFQSDKGIWLLGRDLSTQYIGAPVQRYNTNTVASALVIPGTTQVRFTLNTGVILMYDYFFNQWGTFNGAGGVSSVIYQSLHTYVDGAGALFQESPGVYTDEGVSDVLMSFTTSWINLAGLQGFQRAYWFYVLGTYLTPHTMTWGIAYDYDSTIVQTTTITPDSSKTVEQWRVFLDRMKCESIQLTFNETDSTPGAGLTLSGLNMVIGTKKGYNTLKPSYSAG